MAIAEVLNNEITKLNIAGVDNDIKDAATRNIIAFEEAKDHSAHNYNVNEYFIWWDRKLYKAIMPIAAGDTFMLGTNIQSAGTISDQIYNLYIQSADNIRANISNVEENRNASRAYYEGEYLLLAADGQLYRVTTFISLGTHLDVGTNIERVDNITKLINDLEKRITNTQSMMAYVERFTNATKAHAVGDQFIFKDTLVKATAAISVGDEITLNGNCEKTKDFTEKTKEIDDLRHDIQIIQKRKVIFIGDSYCDQNRGEYPYGVFSRFCALAGLYGTDARLYQKGGAGFAGSGQGKTFGDLINDAISEAYFNADEVTDVIFAGGCNDRAYTQQVVNEGKDTAVGAAHSAFPNATIFIACCGGFVNADLRAELINKVNSTYTYMPKYYMIPVMNAMRAMTLLSCFENDGVHPNKKGVDRIAFNLAMAFLRKTSYAQPMTDRYSMTPALISGEITRTPSFVVREKLDHIEISFVKGAGIETVGNRSFAYNTGGSIRLGKVSNTGNDFLVPNCIDQNAEPIYKIPAIIYAYKGNVTEWDELVGEIIIVQTENAEARVFFRTETAPRALIESSNFRMTRATAIVNI